MSLMDLFIKIGVDDDASDKLPGITSKFKSVASSMGKGLATAAKVGAAAVGAAATGIAALTKASIDQFAEYEQLAGGAQKIFDQMDYSKIADDANNAYKELGLSANQYLAVINDVGATFAATMGDEAGYETAKTGLKAISDYASGTGKNVDELSQKFTLITRSTSSYQSIADQFSGILPATSAGFLEQAQAAGILSDSYTQLTEVPIAEYQAAVSQMLQQGVADLGLANNTMNEAFSTLSGSLSMAKGAWSNLVAGLTDDTADLNMLIGNFVESVGAVATNLIPKISVALNGAAKLISEVIPAIVNEIPKLIEENLSVLAEAAVKIIQSLMDGISKNQAMLIDTILDVVTFLAESFIKMLPQIVQLGLDVIVSLAKGIAENIQTLIPTIVDVILKIVEVLTSPENLSNLLDAALTIIMELARGLVDAIPKLIDATILIIENLIKFLLDPENILKLVEAAIEIVLAIGEGLIKAIPHLIASAVELVASIVETILNTDWLQIGEDIINGIWEGIKKMWEKLTKWFSDAWDSLVGGIKDFLGIKSPSKVFAEIGKNMALGVGEGWDDEFGDVEGNIENGMDFGVTQVEYETSGNSSLKSQLANQGTGFGQNSGDITIVVESKLDGATLARNSYKYNQRETNLRGASLVEVSG